MKHKNKCDFNDIQGVYKRIISGESRLYVAWPGKWGSDLFNVDDLDAFANSFGLERGAWYPDAALFGTHFVIFEESRRFYTTGLACLGKDIFKHMPMQMLCVT